MISAREFSKRRKEIIEKMNPNSCMILFSGCELKASEDAVHDFWVNRNFYYLTGINQKETYCVLTKNSENLYILNNDEKLAVGVPICLLYWISVWISPNFIFPFITDFAPSTIIIRYVR